MRLKIFFLLLFLFFGVSLFSSIALDSFPHSRPLPEALPPSPHSHVDDPLGILEPSAATSLDQELAQFEQKSSNQIVVAILPSPKNGMPIEGYAQELFQAWHLGTKKNDNGVLLLCLPQSHRLRIHTGYGLEGALPDALCKRIIEEEILPFFRQGDPTRGIIKGVTAIMKATQGEYHASAKSSHHDQPGWLAFLLSPLSFFLLLLLASFWIRKQQSLGTSSKNQTNGLGGILPPIDDRDDWSDGPGGGWGGFSGGGGFFGGGGSSGGGGASGGW